MALLWLQTSPLGIMLAVSSWGLSGPQEPLPSLAWAAGVALGMICAIPLGLIYLALHRWRIRKATSRWLPLLAWRAFALGLFLGTANLAGIAGLNQTYTWYQAHDWLSKMQLACAACAVGVTLESMRYQRRVRTAAEPRDQPC